MRLVYQSRDRAQEMKRIGSIQVAKKELGKQYYVSCTISRNFLHIL